MDAHRERILTDIGIDVWRARSAGSAAAGHAAVADAPVPESAQTAPIDAPPAQEAQVDKAQLDKVKVEEVQVEEAPSVRLHFYYIKTEHVICLHAENLAQSHDQFIRDLVGACAYLHQSRAAEPTSEQAQFSQGEFKWPILDNGGSPERALDAFFAKHEIGDPTDWVLATRDMLAAVEGMLSLSAETIAIPEIAALASDARLKRELWVRLKRIQA